MSGHRFVYATSCYGSVYYRCDKCGLIGNAAVRYGIVDRDNTGACPELCTPTQELVIGSLANGYYTFKAHRNIPAQQLLNWQETLCGPMTGLLVLFGHNHDRCEVASSSFYVEKLHLPSSALGIWLPQKGVPIIWTTEGIKLVRGLCGDQCCRTLPLHPVDGQLQIGDDQGWYFSIPKEE